MNNVQAPRWNELLRKVQELFQRELEGLVRRPYGKVLLEMCGKTPLPGIYLIFDEHGLPFYIGKAQNSVRTRLADHVRKEGDFIQFFLSLEGFDSRPPMAHRCDCGRQLRCSEGSEKIEDGRTQAAQRIQARILADFKVALLSSDGRTDIPLGLRELERLLQYLLVPSLGGFPHREKGWVPISVHVADHPIPPELQEELS